MSELEEESGQLRQMQLQAFGRTFSGLGVLVGVLANLAILYLTFSFYRAAAVTPAGTSIRPMGLILFYFIIGFGSLITGVPLSVIGAFVCRKARYNRGVNMANKGAILSVLPLPLALALFHLITALFGLKLSD